MPPRIDAHLHLSDPALPGSKPLPEWFGDPARVAERAAATLRAAGTTGAVAMGSLAVSDDDPLGLAGARAAAAGLAERWNGRVALLGVADPRRADDRAHLARAERELAAGGVAGLKAYLGYLHVAPDDARYRPWWELAARYEVPVVLHTGDTYATGAKVRYAHPLHVDAAAVDFPAVRFVMAHFGCPWLLDAAEVLYKNPNVRADLSGWWVGDELADSAARAWFARHLEDAVAYAGDAAWERLMFGSDWPLAPVDGYAEALEPLVPERHREAVFGGTAARLFGLDV